MSIISAVGVVLRFPFSSRTRFLLSGVTAYAAYAAYKVFIEVAESAEYDAVRRGRHPQLVSSSEAREHDARVKEIEKIFQEKAAGRLLDEREGAETSPPIGPVVAPVLQLPGEVVPTHPRTSVADEIMPLGLSLAASSVEPVGGPAIPVKEIQVPGDWLELADTDPAAYYDWTGFLHRVFAGSYADQHPFTSDMAFREEVRKRLIDISELIVFRYYKPGFFMGQKRQKAFFLKLKKRIDRVFAKVLPAFDKLPTPENGDLPLKVQPDISALLKADGAITREAMVAACAKGCEKGDLSLSDWMFGPLNKDSDNPYAKNVKQSRKLRGKDPVLNWIRLFLDGKVEEHPWLVELERNRGLAAAEGASEAEEVVGEEVLEGMDNLGDDLGDGQEAETKLTKAIIWGLKHKKLLLKVGKTLVNIIAPRMIKRDILKNTLMSEEDREFQLRMVEHGFPFYGILMDVIWDNKDSDLFNALWQRLPRLALKLGSGEDSYRGILDAIQMGRDDRGSPPMVMARVLYEMNCANFAKPVPGLREVLEGKTEEGRKIYTLHMMDELIALLRVELKPS